MVSSSTTNIKCIFMQCYTSYRSQRIELHFSVYNVSCLDKMWQFWTKEHTELPPGRAGTGGNLCSNYKAICIYRSSMYVV